jgi:NADH:ubiquinone oxidoreductase subunit 5 (subunit L)/multisubunit Na+/H+ antiporter MnhA subunit
MTALFSAVPEVDNGNVRVIIISIFLMIAILAVSFYEPRWIHSGNFGQEEETTSLRSSPTSFEYVVNLRELISDASQRSVLSKSLASLPVSTEIMQYDSLQVNKSWFFCLLLTICSFLLVNHWMIELFLFKNPPPL